MLPAYITHADCARHEMGPHHPECPERLGAINDMLLVKGLLDYMNSYEAPAATLEQLARSEIKLEYPGNAAALAGHSARFQAVLDPLGLWPMQSFVLSGLLILGRAWDEDEIAELDDEETEALSHEPDEGDSHPEQLPRPPKKKSEKALALDEPTPLPEDGETR